MTTKQNIVVPSIVLRPRETAIRELENAGFAKENIIILNVASDTIDNDLVIKTTPKEGALVSKDEKITVYVSHKINTTTVLSPVIETSPSSITQPTMMPPTTTPPPKPPTTTLLKPPPTTMPPKPSTPPAN